MRRLLSTISISAAVGLGACASVPRTHVEASSVRVACTARLDVDCFDAPSRLCGSAGYDLFDLQGRRATVGDARYRVLEARCRR